MHGIIKSDILNLNAICIFYFSAIFIFAMEGNALKAMELTEHLTPNLLEEENDLRFDLLSLHFVDLLSSRKL